MQPHQQRVVDEKKDLDEKLSKLEVFIYESPVFSTLDGNEQYRLRKQSGTMKDYSRILGERIAAFKD